jgi:hypothetical protein
MEKLREVYERLQRLRSDVEHWKGEANRLGSRSIMVSSARAHEEYEDARRMMADYESQVEKAREALEEAAAGALGICLHPVALETFPPKCADCGAVL